MTAENHERGRTRRRFLQALGAVGVAGLAGCSNPFGTETGKSHPKESELGALSFEGQFFDTHAHWSGFVDHPAVSGAFHTGKGGQVMANNDVGATVLFVSKYQLDKAYDKTLDLLTQDTVEFAPFIKALDRHSTSASFIIEEYERYEDILFGIGEYVFYDGQFQGTAITDEPWPTLFEYAATNDIPLMVHPTKQQKSGFDQMLEQYPNAPIMGHGEELNQETGYLTGLLRDHDNLYWTVDAGSMLEGWFGARWEDASGFADYYDDNYQTPLRLYRSILPDLMAAAPDRVMWGTDIGPPITVDPKVYNRAIDFTNKLLDSLDSTQQEAYTHGNAVKMGKELWGL